MTDTDLYFDYIFRRYYSRLCAYALRFVRDSYIAEEIVQEVFCKIHQDIEKTCEVEFIKSYLFKLVGNACLNYLKHEATLKKHETQYCYDNSEDFTYTIDEVVLEEKVEGDLISQIHSTIDSLPEQCKLIFKLKKMDGFSHEQISKMLGISKKTIESQITIAVKKIRKNILFD